MNPYDEQRLRDEVIYLHSLWRQGPPKNPNRPPKLIVATHNPSTNLVEPSSTNTNTRPFKKQKTKEKRIKNTTSQPRSDSDRAHDSGYEWPVNPTPSPPATTGWAEVKPETRSKPGPVSPEDEAKMLAMRVLHKSLDSCREFFSDKVESDEEDEESGEEDYLTENERVVESEEYKFLLRMFVKDDNLRGYFEKNHESGDFCCLVCGSIGKKVNKKYKDCLALVQHAISISKTKRKRAHRAFGQVVCRVLGWDIDRLPVVVLTGETLGKSLMNSGVTQGEVVIGNGENNEGVTVVKNNEGSVTGNNVEMVQKAVSNDNQNASELMICKVEDVNQCVENVDSGFLNTKAGKDIAVCQVNDASKSVKNLVNKDSNMEADTELAVDCQIDDVNKCVENLDSEFLNLGAGKDVAFDSQGSGPSLVTSTGWSSIIPVVESSIIASGWSTLKTQPLLVSGSASTEEQEKLVALQLHQKVSEACREFFEKSADSDDDASDDDDSDSSTDEDGSEVNEEFKFFLKVFVDNNELRSYYEENYGSGEFCCLVCCGIGKKVWRRFRDCLGLLQHSTAISKTKRKRAHRAFGKVVCKVLGWDIDRLPTIVLNGETLGHSLAKLGMSRAEGKTSADCNKDNLSAPTNSADSESAWKEVLALISENSSNGDDANKHVNDIHERNLEMERSKVNNLVPQEKDSIAN